MIRLLETSDASAFFEHLKRHHAESGRDGDLIFSPMPPFEDEWPSGPPHRGWEVPVEDWGWRRAWGLFDGNGGDRIVGHADLKCGVLPTGLHRCGLGMGIERSHRKKGHGRQLLETLIQWSQAQENLDWLDLKVFSHNAPARALYTALGFVENGEVRDFFRVDGQSIDDISMTLWVGKERRHP
jgi:RimJ/RimL family protein N-acetyltransferase